MLSRVDINVLEQDGPNINKELWDTCDLFALLKTKSLNESSTSNHTPRSFADETLSKEVPQRDELFFYKICIQNIYIKENINITFNIVVL